MKFFKFAVDQKKKTNTRKLRVSRLGPHKTSFPVQQCHVAEQKECQGFNVPRLYHSALSLNAAAHVVLTVCCGEPTAPLHCPSHRFWLSGDSWLDLGWLISVETNGMQAQSHLLFPLDQLYFARYVSESWSVASPLSSLCPVEAYSCISLCYWLKCVACVCVCVCEPWMLMSALRFYVLVLRECVFMPVHLCACVYSLEHIHQSPYLKPVVPALWHVQHSHLTLLHTHHCTAQISTR